MIDTNETDSKTLDAIAFRGVKEEETVTLSIIPLNPDRVAVDYMVACDLETELVCAVFEDEDEDEDEWVLDDQGVAVRRGTNEVPQQFYQELRKRTEARKSSPVKGVCLRHYEEFKKSGISDEFIKSAFISLLPEALRGHLGWRGSEDQPGGWAALTVNPQDEKADRPLVRVKIDSLPDWLVKGAKENAEKDGKEYKEPKRYQQKKGIPTEPIFLKVLRVGDCETWSECIADPSIPFVITEGEKKAALLLSLGIPCIALPGVWNWQADAGTKALHPWLKAIAARGRQVYLAFDADWQSNQNVAMSLRELSEQLEIEKATVRGIFWDVNRGKGIDDYLMNFPESDRKGELGRLINSARSVREQLSGGGSQVTQGKQPKKPPFGGSHAANYLAEKYRSKLAWNTEINMFMQYGCKHDGVWSAVAPEAVIDVISSEMDKGSLELDGCPGHSHNQAMSVFNLLKGKLIRGEWKERDNSLPFENGVLDLETGKLLPHSPINYFTWQIPRSHDPKAKEFPKINEWLDWVSDGDEQFKLLLLSWLNAVLVVRSDLHKFFNAYGTGRNGKGLHQNIAIALIGDKNVHTSDLRTWNENNFEASNAYGKRLIVMPDEDKCKVGIGQFKKVTGGDLLRCEKKGKDATNFTYKGMVMLSSNYPVFQGENSTALSRRTILAEFKRTISEAEQREMMPEFEPELSALTNYLLAMDGELVVKTLKGLNASERMKESTQAYQLRSNPLLAWVNDYLAYEEGGEEAVGSNRDDPSTLYGSYCNYCKNAGNSPKSLQNFSSDLVDLLTNTLGWKGVKKRPSSRGKTKKFTGARGSFIDNIKIVLSGDLA